MAGFGEALDVEKDGIREKGRSLSEKVYWEETDVQRNFLNCYCIIVLEQQDQRLNFNTEFEPGRCSMAFCFNSGTGVHASFPKT